VSLAVLLLAAAGCDKATPLGPCVGLNGVERPELRYEYSAKNIILGIVFFEVVAPPVIVVLNELKCPVSTKAARPAGAA
jgi:hypothetical protein